MQGARHKQVYSLILLNHFRAVAISTVLQRPLPELCLPMLCMPTSCMPHAALCLAARQPNLSAEADMHQAACSASQNVNAVVPSGWTKAVAEEGCKTHQHLRFLGDHSAEY